MPSRAKCKVQDTRFLLDHSQYTKIDVKFGTYCHVEFPFKFFDKMINKRIFLKSINLQNRLLQKNTEVYNLIDINQTSGSLNTTICKSHRLSQE